VGVHSVSFKAVRGFKDILPGEVPRWIHAENTARRIFRAFGFQEIRPPMLEYVEVFTRGIGQHTDIVEKEMYAFTDKNGENVCLRPEATGGVLRAVIENGLANESPILRLFTLGPMFRHERPQKGRLRQFHQMNSEVIGSHSPHADAEVIWLAWEILRACSSAELILDINTLGCPACRPTYRKVLQDFLEKNAGDLCQDCARRRMTNPLRVLDCKNEVCKSIVASAPHMGTYLCPACAGHHEKVREALDSIGIPSRDNPSLVRGLDYYVRTAFEISSPVLGAQSTVAAGGRYDGLLKAMEGPDLPGVGMAVGLERLLLLGEGPNASVSSTGPDLFVAYLDDESLDTVLPWILEWRRRGISVLLPHETAGLKTFMKQADRAHARFVIIIGEEERTRREGILRDMATRGQSPIPFDSAVAAIATILEETL